MKDGSIMVIGIAGGTGSGKTTITRKIMQHFGGNVSVIYHPVIRGNYQILLYNTPLKLWAVNPLPLRSLFPVRSTSEEMDK